MSRESAISTISALNEFIEAISRPLNQYGHKPLPGSQATKELAEFSRADSIGTAFSQGSIHIEVAADYAFAVAKTLSEPAEAFAPWTCARGVLETSALSMWLLDTKITSEERVKRSFAFRYEGLDQQKKLAQTTDSGFDPNIIIQRIEEVEKVANELGFNKVIDRNSKRIGIGQQMPKITHIINMMLKKEKNYRLFSAVAHGHHWALTQVGFIQKLKNQDIFENVQGVYLEKSLSIEIIKFLCRDCIENLSQALLMYFDLFGWDNQTIHSATTSSLVKIMTT